jgi:tRNA dimethylallyltransferase
MSLSDASDGADSLPRAERGVIPVICGPTAAGKSEIALRLAEQFGRAIVVADSRQVYRRFDIGTAKPSAGERRRVTHFGIDLVDPSQRYSAAQWVSDASTALQAQPKAIIAGGTGLYLRALFEGLFSEPEIDAARRSQLLGWLETQTTDELRRWTQHLDPVRAHLGRTQLLRAIEIALLTGNPISRLHAEAAGSTPISQPSYLVIDPGPVLQERIAKRFDQMVEAGWLEEIQALRSAVPDDAPAWNASGYRALREVVDGSLTLRRARDRVIIETRQYAKRQRTWFRHQLPPQRTMRVNPLDDGAEQAIERWWRSVNRE